MDQRPARERLADAAIAAFAESGYHATTTRDIAARASMSPAALYVHHDSKESLLFALSLDGHQETLDVVRQAAARTDRPVQRLRGIVYDFTLWHAEHTPRARVLQYEFRALSPDHRKVIADYRRDIEATMNQVLDDGVRQGIFRIQRLPETGRAILSLGVDVVRWFEPGRERTAQEVAELYTELALKMVGI